MSTSDHCKYWFPRVLADITVMILVMATGGFGVYLIYYCLTKTSSITITDVVAIACLIFISATVLTIWIYHFVRYRAPKKRGYATIEGITSVR